MDAAEAHKSIRTFFKVTRAMQELGQVEVAEALGINRSVLSGIENGKRLPKIEHIQEMFTLYGGSNFSFVDLQNALQICENEGVVISQRESKVYRDGYEAGIAEVIGRLEKIDLAGSDESIIKDLVEIIKEYSS